MANELAPGSEWMIDPDDGAAFIASEHGHRVDITVYEPKCLMITMDEETVAAADVRDVLALIDRAGLDPVRTAARALLKRFDDITRETHEPNDQVGAECFVGEHVRIDDVIDELNALEALL